MLQGGQAACIVVFGLNCLLVLVIVVQSQTFFKQISSVAIQPLLKSNF